MTKYRTYLSKISKVEVERETKHMVCIKGRMRAKVTGWDNYHDTWCDAYSFLLRKAKGDVSQCKMRLNKAKDAVLMIEQLQPMT